MLEASEIQSLSSDKIGTKTFVIILIYVSIKVVPPSGVICSRALQMSCLLYVSCQLLQCADSRSLVFHFLWRLKFSNEWHLWICEYWSSDNRCRTHKIPIQVRTLTGFTESFRRDCEMSVERWDGYLLWRGVNSSHCQFQSAEGYSFRFPRLQKLQR